MALKIARNDFTFAIDSEHFHCNHFQSVFLSLLIANIISADLTVDEFVIKISNSDSNSDIDFELMSAFAFTSIKALEN
jgi:hypothetical protein